MLVAGNAKTAKRVRSPNFSITGLREAVQQIHRLFEKISRHPAPRKAIASALGYTGLHGRSESATSALHKYGLLERDGAENTLSTRAMEIIAPQSGFEKADALRDAARGPVLFAELIDHFKGSVPGDELLRAYLIRRGFAAAVVPQVIHTFRETKENVTRETALYPSSEPANRKVEKVDQEEEHTHSQIKRTAGEREFFSSPLSGQTRVRILMDGPAGPKEIEKLIKLLTVQKEVIQEEDQADSEE